MVIGLEHTKIGFANTCFRAPPPLWFSEHLSSSFYLVGIRRRESPGSGSGVTHTGHDANMRTHDRTRTDSFGTNVLGALRLDRRDPRSAHTRALEMAGP